MSRLPHWGGKLNARISSTFDETPTFVRALDDPLMQVTKLNYAVFGWRDVSRGTSVMNFLDEV